jgi:hypothetical protein
LLSLLLMDTRLTEAGENAPLLSMVAVTLAMVSDAPNAAAICCTFTLIMLRH